MTGFNQILNAWRKWAVYPAICLVIIGLAMSQWFPPFAHLISPEEAGIFFCLLLFLVYSNLDSRLDRLVLRTGQAGPMDFATAFQQLLELGGPIESLDFCGSTGGLFHPTFWARKPHVKRMRVLIRDPRSVVRCAFPSSREAKAALKQRIIDRQVDWSILVDQEIVDHMSVRTYDFAPSFFAVIINRCQAFWGIFRQTSDYPYFHVMSCFVFDGTTPMSAKFVDDIESWFDAVYDQSKTAYER
jgi:hypothetical protein